VERGNRRIWGSESFSPFSTFFTLSSLRGREWERKARRSEAREKKKGRKGLREIETDGEREKGRRERSAANTELVFRRDFSLLSLSPSLFSLSLR
jgi:hypothetical protein